MWFEAVSRDLRFAVRMDRRNPVSTIIAVLTLALAVGATTSIFSVVKAVLINQLPYGNPDRLVELSQVDLATPGADGLNGLVARELQSRTRSLDSLSLYADGQRTLVEHGNAEVLRGMRVSHDFFETLGVNMFLGRAFLASEDQWPRANAVILSHGLWARRFGGDPRIVGRVLELSTEAYRVIGVLPPDFYPLRMSNPAEKPQIFMPLGEDPQGFGGNAIARLKPGVSADRGRMELNGVMHEIAPGISVRVEPLRDRLVGPIRPALLVLLCAVTFVLLIACCNIANLLLARATARAKEMALRAALGGSRWRLAGQMLTESLLLSFAGGAAGVLLAWQGTSALAALAPRELARLDEIRMDGVVLLFGMGISLVSGVFFGAVPAWRASRLDLNSALKRSSGAASQRALLGLLVVAEVALAFLLAEGTGLLGKSFLRLTEVDAGFDPHHVLTLSVSLTGSRYATDEAVLRHYRQVVESVRRLPGVLGAGMISDVPMSHTQPMQLRVAGGESLSDSEAPSADVFWVSPDALRVLKIPLQRGRSFTDQDGVEHPPVAIVSDSVARSRFPGADAIGQRIQLGSLRNHGPWFTIVGIVGDVRQNGLDREPDEAVYLPQALGLGHYTRLIARTAGDPMSLERAIRAAVREIDPLQPVFHVQPMDNYVASFLSDRSFALALIGLFGTLALLLAAIGVYGVVSYSAGLRTREVGIRMALGAQRPAILRLIFRDVLTFLAWGLAAGFFSALVLTRLLSHMLFEVRRTDVATLVGAGLLLASAAVLAACLPAFRAASVDPTQALRLE